MQLCCSCSKEHKKLNSCKSYPLVITQLHIFFLEIRIVDGQIGNYVASNLDQSADPIGGTGQHRRQFLPIAPDLTQELSLEIQCVCKS